MAATYEKIATTTLGSSQSSVTFSSIPATYTDLVIIINSVMSNASELRYRFNGDSGSNYSFIQLYNSGGGVAGSSRDSNRTIGRMGSTRTAQNVHIGHINNYSNTTTYKTVLSRESAGGSDSVQAFVGLWRSTSAINEIVFSAETGTFSSGTVFTLYGIKAA
jgi:hypothetical protein